MQRLYTASSHDAYAPLSFAVTPLELARTDTGATATLPVEVPAAWAYQSVTTLAEKVLHLHGVPKRLRRIKETGVPAWLWRSAAVGDSKTASENSFKQIFDRVSGALTYTGWKGGYFAAKNDAKVFYDELRYLLASQKLAFAPNLYALTGLYWGYGLTGDLDNGVWLDPHSNRLRTRVMRYEQPICLDAPAQATVDFSGPVCTELLIQQQARTVENAVFAMGRRLLQQQLAALYDAARTGDDLPGHIRAADAAGVPQKMVQDVLLAARTETPCPTVPDGRFFHEPTESAKPFIRIAAQDFQNPGDRWHDLVSAIWQHGDPGLILAPNHDDAAPRATLNLAAFLGDASTGGGFDHTGFAHASKIAAVALDIALNQTAHHSEAAARHARHRRAISLGFTNLAPLLLALGHAYDSAAGRATAACVASLMTGTALATAAEAAARCGPAPAFKECRESTLRQLRQHRRAVYGATEPHEPPGIALQDCADLALIAAARRVWDQALDMAAVTGLRNMSVSFILDDSVTRDFLGAECSGITPLKRLVHDRQTGPDAFSCAPLPEIAAALDNLGYTPEAQNKLLSSLLTPDSGTEFIAALSAGHRPTFSTLDNFGEGELPPAAIIRMAAMVQSFLTGQLEVNLPLPETTTVAALDEYIRMAAAAGLKNLRCLRAGSDFGDTAAASGPNVGLAASTGQSLGALPARTAEQGYARPDFRAVRTGNPARARLRVRVSATTPPVEKLN